MIEQFIGDLNVLLAEDLMHGIQWCDLDNEEQRRFLQMWDMGMTPKESLDALMEGPLQL